MPALSSHAFIMIAVEAVAEPEDDSGAKGVAAPRL
jgi:hypothetical protein